MRDQYGCWTRVNFKRYTRTESLVNHLFVAQAVDLRHANMQLSLEHLSHSHRVLQIGTLLDEGLNGLLVAIGGDAEATSQLEHAASAVDFAAVHAASVLIFGLPLEIFECRDRLKMGQNKKTKKRCRNWHRQIKMTCQSWFDRIAQHTRLYSDRALSFISTSL